MPRFSMGTIVFFTACLLALALMLALGRRFRAFSWIFIALVLIGIFLSVSTGSRVIDFHAVGQWIWSGLEKLIRIIYDWVQNIFLPHVENAVSEVQQ